MAVILFRERWVKAYSAVLSEYSDNVNVGAEHQEPAEVLSQLDDTRGWRY